MECLKETPLLKFNPNTLEDVRKELNLHNPGVMEQLLNNLEDWISKQNHFTKRTFDRHYLETSIVFGKGSLERAKKVLDKLCTLKTLLPEFFSKHNVKKDLADTSGFLIQATMPKLSKDNYRVYVVKMVSTDFGPSQLFDFHRMSILMCEYIKCNDYSLGYIGVIDCRDVNLINMMTKINVVDLHNTMSVLIDGYSLRIKAIHLISTSRAIDTFIALLKQVISAKIADRIKVHRSIETLHENVQREILPEEYGGDETPVKNIYENWVNVLSQEENVDFFRDICKAGTDEKYRLTEKYNDEILGMPGSFRTLTVD